MTEQREKDADEPPLECGVRGWQPIETAPNGTMALFCSMATDDVKKWAFVDWLAYGEFMLHPTWGATHWMPLPEPPNATGEARPK